MIAEQAVRGGKELPQHFLRAGEPVAADARVIAAEGLSADESTLTGESEAAEKGVIAAARQCRTGQTPAPFTQITPTQTDDGNLVAYLAEDSEYDDEQARLAGIQRLLVIAGYDAAPIDGVDGGILLSAHLETEAFAAPLRLAVDARLIALATILRHRAGNGEARGGDQLTDTE